MKNTTVFAICAHLLVLLWTSVPALAESAPELRGIRFESASPGSEKVVLQLNGSYSPNMFTIKDETPRLVLDFADMTYTDKVKHATTVNGSIVKRIRVGRHDDNGQKTRVVLDLATLKGVSYEKELDEKSSTLTLSISKEGSTAAKAKPAADKPTEQTKKVTAEKLARSPSPEAQADQAKTEAKDNPQADSAAATQPGSAPVTPAPSEQGPAPATSAAAPEPEAPAKMVAAGEKTDTAVKKGEPEATAAKTEGPAPASEQAQQAKTADKGAVAEQAANGTTPATKPTEQVDAAGQSSQAQPEEKPAADKPPAEQPKAETAATSQPAKQPEVAKQAEGATKTDAKVDAAGQQTGAKEGEPATTGDKEATAAKKSAPTGPMIESVKFDGKSPKGEMVLFKLNEFHPPSVHGVEEGIPRVICDFKNTQLAESTDNLIKTDGKYVKVIRISKSKKPDKVRVVLDLEPNKSYDLQQVFFKEDNLFVLIINTVKS